MKSTGLIIYGELRDMAMFADMLKVDASNIYRAAEEITDDIILHPVTVDHIKDVMTKLKYTVEQAMDLLNIPQKDWDTYAGLVNKKM